MKYLKCIITAFLLLSTLGCVYPPVADENPSLTDESPSLANEFPPLADEEDFVLSKIVFVSSRTNPVQLFLKDVKEDAPPIQLTDDYLFKNKRHPSWSYNGAYIVYAGKWRVTQNPDIPALPYGPCASQDPPEQCHSGEWIDVIDGENGDSVFQPRYMHNEIYPNFSPDGSKIIFTGFDMFDWPERALYIVELDEPYDFSKSTLREFVANDFNGAGAAPTDGDFTPDGEYYYFHADTNSSEAGVLYRAKVKDGTVEQVIDKNGAPIKNAYHPSISANGAWLLFNSTLNAPNMDGEELMSLNLATGEIIQLTELPGNQSGAYRKNGNTEELVISSRLSNADPRKLYFLKNATLELAVQSNPDVDDYMPDWWLSPRPGPADPCDVFGGLECAMIPVGEPVTNPDDIIDAGDIDPGDVGDNNDNNDDDVEVVDIEEEQDDG